MFRIFHNSRTFSLALILPLLVLGTGSALAQAMTSVRVGAVPAFTIHGVGPASVSTQYLPEGVNSTRTVAGTVTSTSADQAFFSAKGKVHAVSPPTGAAGSRLHAINDSGMVAGESCVNAACDNTRAYSGKVKNGHLHWKKLPPASGSSLCGVKGCDSTAQAISPTGNATGQYASQAILWSRSAKGKYHTKKLPYGSTAPGFKDSIGLAVDNFGDAAGTEDRDNFVGGVFWPAHGSPVILPDCQQLLVTGGGVFEHPYAMVARGKASKRSITIVGSCLVKSATTDQLGSAPCLWRVTVSGSGAQVAPPVRLDSNDGSVSGRALGINGKGWIVGNQGDANSTPTLWVNRQPHPLASLIPANTGWTLRMVYAMSGSGDITGVGMDNGQPRAFLLRPR